MSEEVADCHQLIEQTQSLMSITEKPSPNPHKMRLSDPIVVVKDITVENKTSQRGKMVPFTKAEDKFLKDGLKKHGKSWTKIIRDDLYRFNPSRKTCTLLKRAKVLGLVTR